MGRNLLLLVLLLLSTEGFSQTVNLEVNIRQYNHQFDCTDDGGGLSGDPDPAWKVWVGFSGGNFQFAQQCGGDDDCSVLNVNDFDILNVSNTTATQVNLDLESWENDCGGDCSYNANGNITCFCCEFFNPDDAYNGRTRRANTDFRDDFNENACQFNVYTSGANSGNYSVEYDIYWSVNTISGNTIAGGSTVCASQDPAQLNHVSHAQPNNRADNSNGLYTYQWQSASDAAFTQNVVNIPGATGINYDPGLLTQTTYFRRVATTTCAKNSVPGPLVTKEHFSNVLSVIVNPSPTVTNIQVQNITCNGANNGAITVTASGGVGALVYSVNGGGAFQGNGNFTNLGPGAYTILVIDQQGCGSSLSVITLSEPPPLVVNNVTFTDVTQCFGNNNGSISVLASGGTGSLEYTVDGGTTWVTTPVIGGLGAGSYQVRVRDANGCISGISPVTLTQPQQLTFTTSEVDIAGCNGDLTGQITLTGTGGTGLLEYSIDGGNTYQASNVFSNLPGGIYNTFVRDANGCVVGPEVVTINQPTPITFSLTETDVTQCFYSTNGTISVSASGGTGLLEYSIDLGTTWQLSPTFSNLGSGTYFVTVRDANFCRFDTLSTVLSAPDTIQFSTFLKDVLCEGGDDGQLAFSATGGTGSLSFSIDGGNTFQPSPIFLDLVEGIYQVVISDANGCTVGETDTIDATNPLPQAVITPLGSPVVCAPDVVTLEALAGTNYTYQWYINGLPAIGETNQQLIAIQSASYTVVVFDGICTNTSNPVVVDINYFEAEAVATVTNLPCSYSKIGEATVQIITGAPPYQFAWSTIPVQTTQTAIGLEPGIYGVIATDSNGCTVIDTVEITSPDQIDLETNTQDPGCFNGNDGLAVVSVSGGVAPYSYSWSSVPAQTASVAVDLSAGSYQVIVNDANGCSAVANVTLSEPTDIELTGSTTPVDCGGGAKDGTATVVATGGTPPYSYLWNDDQAQTTDVATGLSPGPFGVLVTDANNCPKVFTVVVGTVGFIAASVQVTDESCAQAENGIAVASVVGGAEPYSYNWSLPTDPEGNIATNLDEGNYTVTVTDDNGCKDTVFFAIDVLPEVIVTLPFEEVTIVPGEEVVLTPEVSRNADFTFEWVPNSFISNAADSIVTVNPEAAVTYIVVATEVFSGCRGVDSVAIKVANEFVVPNIFTPNGDDINPVFFPVVRPGITVLDFQVFNRWGTIVHDDPNNPWDGTYQQELQPNGVYIYQGTLQRLNGELISIQGEVTLAR